MTDPADPTLSLLRRWNSGDQSALHALMALHLGAVRALVHGRLGPELRRKAETDDLVQQAMIRLLHYAPRFEVADERQFRALVGRIVENSIRDEVRKLRREVRDLQRERGDSVLQLHAPVDSKTPPADAASRGEYRTWVQLAIELLDPPDRDVILLREWERLEFGEIAGALGLSEDVARKRFQRALPKLHRLLIQLRGRGLGAVPDL